MNDKTLDDMNRRRMGFKDYVICFLLAVIAFVILGYETRANEMETRLADHKTTIDKLLESNKSLKEQVTEQTIKEVVELTMDDIKRDWYLEGWDEGYADAGLEKISLLPFDKNPHMWIPPEYR